MEERYFVNGNKKNKRTWRELLQWCYNSLNSEESRKGPYWHWRDELKPLVKAYEPARFNSFFSDYRHNDNDWAYWTHGQYERIFIGYDEDTKAKIYENGAWIPPTYVVPTKGWYVEDSFGRIIPSGYIKACLKEFKPYIPTEPIKRGKYWRHRGNFVFRRGPVENISNHYHRGHHWHKYKGNHGGFGNECRQNEIFKTELRDIREEFGVEVKYSKRRANFVYDAYVDWDWNCYYHNKNTKGHGWKRTRKKKQWM